MPKRPIIIASPHLDTERPVRHIGVMRTTVVIDDDVLEAARSLSEAEGKSLGEVLSQLARRGLAPRPQLEEDAGFPVFSVSPEAKPITLEMVQKALDED